MQVDVIGVSAVANLIRQTNLNKFVINRYGAGVGAAPVFEHLTGSQNKRAVDAFTEWANNVLNSNPQNTQAYEILLFNSDTDNIAEGEENEEKINERARSKAKKDKIRFYFALAIANGMSAGSAGNMGGEYLRKEDIAKVIAETLEKNELIRQNKDLSERLTALEEDDNEDFADEGQNEEDVLTRAERLFDKIATHVNPKAARSPQVAAAVGAPEKSAEEKSAIKTNIQTAITRLYKVNSELDRDLLKLADIAEKNPSQFKFFIDALRRM
jgi:phage terminase small subunit